MHTRSFLPSPRASNVLIALGAAALGYALYLRYFMIENSTVGLACEAGLGTPACMVRMSVIFLFRYQVFGVLALIAAIYHLLRPDIYAFAAGMITAAFGLVLYNNGLAALATALLVVSFARPVIVDTPPPEAETKRRATGPASSAAPR
ncbi:MAG TPA: hypothetical protein VKT73_08625 [Xanthobacteraceae bacterium]|nr:hypothetical protein [Xanthobacteraceae bacterium]